MATGGELMSEELTKSRKPTRQQSRKRWIRCAIIIKLLKAAGGGEEKYYSFKEN
jgi:hypothetical protein